MECERIFSFAFNFTSSSLKIKTSFSVGPLPFTSHSFISPATSQHLMGLQAAEPRDREKSEMIIHSGWKQEAKCNPSYLLYLIMKVRYKRGQAVNKLVDEVILPICYSKQG